MEIHINDLVIAMEAIGLKLELHSPTDTSYRFTGPDVDDHSVTIDCEPDGMVNLDLVDRLISPALDEELVNALWEYVLQHHPPDQDDT